jgi:phosphohistidine phosphatase
MQQLTLLRHAKSSWKYVNLNDIERPLKKSGFAELEETTQWIKKQNVIPDLIICSPAVRTYQTALITCYRNNWDLSKIILYPQLYESSLTHYLNILNKHLSTTQHVMLVGHNPVITQLKQYLTSNNQEILTGSLHIIHFNSGNLKKLKKNCGTLTNTFIPTTHLV